MIAKIDKEKIESAAEKLIKRGRLSEAITEYQKLLNGGDQDIPIRNIVGDLYVKSNQKDKAAKEFLKIAEIYAEKGLNSKSIAIYKRIIRLNPDDTETARKLADLYYNQGFISESKTEYLNLAKRFKKEKKNREAILIFEKLLKIDQGSRDARLTLADLYSEEGNIEPAVEELNAVAEDMIRKNELKDAEGLLLRARKIKDTHLRTLANLIELLKLQDKKQEALSLIDEVLEKDTNNIKALHLQGNLFYENGEAEKAEAVFNKILGIKPNDVDSRVKLGKIAIQRDQLDKAFALYDPLVDTLLRKQKGDKAIGLMGLLLETKKLHLPTIEKLASIYQARNQKKNLEIVYGVLLEEYRQRKLREKVLTILDALLLISPENKRYVEESAKLRKELGISEKTSPQQESPPKETAEDIIQEILLKVDLHLEQGLIRNAKRILENLRMRFPDDPRVMQKVEELAGVETQVNMNDLQNRVEKVARRETEIHKKDFVPPGEDLMGGGNAGLVDDKLTAADLFAETDIIPFMTQQTGEKKYFDLSENIDEELEAIQAIFNYQIRGDTTIVEKALSDIVSEFRKALDEKVEKEDYRSHYDLAIAFLEQRLFDEAIEECKLASHDENLRLECFSVISHCYREKKDYDEAIQWLDEAIAIVEENSSQAYALKYEKAILFEDLKDNKNADKLFSEVYKWNAHYRDIAKKVK